LIYKIFLTIFGRPFLREIARSFSKPKGRRIEPVRPHQQQVLSVAAASRLGRQLEEVIASLSKVDARFALIGGLALASHKVIRATQDIDLLTDSEKAEDIDRELVALGYQCLHRSADAGNYLRGDERVDFIYASRPAARGLLSNATSIQTAFGEVRVVSTEGLIGLKLQGFVNNPRRTQDLEDIKALIAANRQALKMDEVREYFRLFNREALLEEILK
jgi:predicted nucleotidyltransferase